MHRLDNLAWLGGQRDGARRQRRTETLHAVRESDDADRDVSRPVDWPLEAECGEAVADALRGARKRESQRQVGLTRACGGEVNVLQGVLEDSAFVGGDWPRAMSLKTFDERLLDVLIVWNVEKATQVGLVGLENELADGTPREIVVLVDQQGHLKAPK